MAQSIPYRQLMAMQLTVFLLTDHHWKKGPPKQAPPPQVIDPAAHSPVYIAFQAY